jgi:CelD/BcsL family acetyltransferase involved in cellulose biosynthesis
VSNFDLAQLRHAYAQLVAKGMSDFANGLIAPVIRNAERRAEGWGGGR